jgi:hypothetical protein
MTAAETRLPGLGYLEYRELARAIGIEPDDRLMTPIERQQALPAWLTFELLLGEGRRKLSDWAARTPAPWATLTPVGVLTTFACYGDFALANVAARVLAERIPPPVTAYIIERVAITVAGAQLWGWCGPPKQEPTRPLRILAVHNTSNLDLFEAVLAEEIAHAWQMKEPTPGQKLATAFWYSTVEDTPIGSVPEQSMEAVVAWRGRGTKLEDIAQRLIRSWGFTDPRELV